MTQPVCPQNISLTHFGDFSTMCAFLPLNPYIFLVQERKQSERGCPSHFLLLDCFLKMLF